MRILLIIFIALLGCSTNPENETKPLFPKGKKIKLWATMYYAKEVEADNVGIPLRNLKNEVIGPKLRADKWCKAAIEGTVVINGVTYNYAGTRRPSQASCSHAPSSFVRWKVSKFKYGIGSKNNPLKPFVSIAVDNKIIPHGSKVFIPDALGVEYVFEGKRIIHDGIFIADDVGGLIKGNHIDVFLGVVKGGLKGALRVNPFSFIKSNPSGLFEAVIVK